VALAPGQGGRGFLERDADGARRERGGDDFAARLVLVDVEGEQDAARLLLALTGGLPPDDHLHGHVVDLEAAAAALAFALAALALLVLALLALAAAAAVVAALALAAHAAVVGRADAARVLVAAVQCAVQLLVTRHGNGREARVLLYFADLAAGFVNLAHLGGAHL